jgi:excisionase family DNA binding protein
VRPLLDEVAKVGLPPPKFCSVGEIASMFGMSEMTLYRAIRDGEFPAVRIRGRLIIPARAIEEIVDAAVGVGSLVDARDWVHADPLADSILDRPRPGANQTGAGSPIAQQGAREVSSMPGRKHSRVTARRAGAFSGGVR